MYTQSRSRTSFVSAIGFIFFIVVISLALFSNKNFQIARAVSFVVDDAGDDSDALPSDGICATAGAVCTLRAAIEEANAAAGPDTISFNLPGSAPFVIQPVTVLPTIVGELTIDATSQPGVELDGQLTGGSGPGLHVLWENVVIRGFAIYTFDEGIRFGVGADAGLVEGMLIGTNFAGDAGIGNPNAGISLQSDNTTIGGTTAAQRNIISGNDGGAGVNVAGSGNIIQGNYIGTSIDGSTALQNLYGIASTNNNAINNLYGGTTPGAGNVISGNTGGGILLSSVILTAGTTSIFGNIIGLSATGTIEIPNVGGVVIDTVSEVVQLGGPAANQRNIISGNLDAAVVVTGSFRVIVQGNYIGVGPDGTTAHGNTVGVHIGGIGLSSTIGGTGAGEGNIIANNTEDGVRLEPLTTPIYTVPILSNSIYGNGLGIDLLNDGVTANDANDTDNGPNNLQNYPVLASASIGATDVTGTLDSNASSAFTIQFFSTPTCNASGNGEGQTFLGSTVANTNGSGDATFSGSFADQPAGSFITATATNPNNGTSEFSACSQVLATDLSTSIVSNTPAPRGGDTVTFTVTVTNNGPTTSNGTSLVALLPSSLEFVSANASQGTYVSGTGFWDIGTLTNGQIVTLQIVVIVEAESGTIVFEVSSLNGDIPDVNPANNTALVQISVVPLAPNDPDDPSNPALSTACGTKGCIVTMPGPRRANSPKSIGPLVQVFTPIGTKLTQFGSFYAFSKSYQGGGYLAIGDIDTDGADEIIVGEGNGKVSANQGAQRIRVFEKDGTARGIDLRPFSPKFDGGLSVSVGDVDGDGRDKEIATCQASRGQAICKVYRYNNKKEILAYWNAFGSAEVGATIALADIDNDGKDEAIVGAGPGGGTQVRVYDIGSTTVTGFNKGAQLKPISFMAFHPKSRSGVSVSAADVDGDGKAEIAVSQLDSQQEGWVKVYKYNAKRQILANFRAFARDSNSGAQVKLKDMTGDGKAELIVSGWDNGGSHVRSFNPVGGAPGTTDFFAYDKTYRGGVTFDVARW